MSCFSLSSHVCIFINVVIICIYVCPDLHLNYLSSAMCYINDLSSDPQKDTDSVREQERLGKTCTAAPSDQTFSKTFCQNLQKRSKDF